MPKARRESRGGGAGDRPRRPREEREREREREHKRASKRHSASPEKRHSRSAETSAGGSSKTNSQVLSADSLAKLDALNGVAVVKERDRERRRDKERERGEKERGDKERGDKERRARKHQQRRKKRIVSGAAMEEGKGDIVRRRGGGGRERYGERRRGRCLWLAIGVFLLLLVILVPVGVLVVGKKSGSGGSSGSGGAGKPANNNLNSISASSIPAAAKGTILDPFSWYDTTDFNVTYTDVKVGGLPVMGLNTSFSDSAAATSKTPPLNQPWQYGTMPIRGVNVGGWLSIEPFITPSMFQSYDASLGIVDEYTLTQHLGASAAAQTLEKHYATFVTEQTFIDIAAAGLDHVRIPFSYWAVVTYPNDPYVPQISWRYLLRGIEWARKHGLRVNLDLHALPGSQNGWNHSGRQGVVGWLNGTDGALNGQRSLDIHNQLSQFFAQPRYKNVVTLYGLVNEPKMTKLPVATVDAWTTNATQIVQNNNLTATVIFADGFLGLPNWKGEFTSLKNLALDVHQYVIFNTDQLAMTHKAKIEFACSGWTAQMQESSSTSTGFGPTLCGEWSQADTDCAPYLNNVNAGPRWTGQLDLGDPSLNVLTPTCPNNAASSVPGSTTTGAQGKSACECTDANAAPSAYSTDYKNWLMTFAEAQMTSFEAGWGWFYWTWDTEAAVQWSYKKGLAAGILPKDPSAGGRGFNCSQAALAALDWSNLPENY